MNEEEKQENNKPTPEEPDRITLANQAAERLEKAAERMEKVTKQAEALRINETFGGRTESGGAPKEESPQEYNERLEAGELNETEKTNQ